MPRRRGRNPNPILPSRAYQEALWGVRVPPKTSRSNLAGVFRIIGRNIQKTLAANYNLNNKLHSHRIKSLKFQRPAVIPLETCRSLSAAIKTLSLMRIIKIHRKARKSILISSNLVSSSDKLFKLCENLKKISWEPSQPTKARQQWRSLQRIRASSYTKSIASRIRHLSLFRFWKRMI